MPIEGNKKVLVVEDDRVVRESLVTKLDIEGFEPIAAHDGQEGLDLALANHPDIILLDIIMPIMDGMTMLKKLRADEWGRGVPVIILTNLTDDDEAVQDLKNQAFDFLVKTDWSAQDVVDKTKKRLGISE